MTADEFRRLALDLPEAVESAHQGHPDFRVAGKVFATLGYPDEEWGMVKLRPEQQERINAAQPAAFVPVKGAWGRKGATSVRLKTAHKTTVRHVLLEAWRNVAPRRLIQRFEEM
jgi:hypothetical protein